MIHLSVGINQLAVKAVDDLLQGLWFLSIETEAVEADLVDER
jgi:hypothetical protein